jgi:hypothetical protein
MSNDPNTEIARRVIQKIGQEIEESMIYNSHSFHISDDAKNKPTNIMLGMIHYVMFVENDGLSWDNIGVVEKMFYETKSHYHDFIFLSQPDNSLTFIKEAGAGWDSLDLIARFYTYAISYLLLEYLGEENIRTEPRLTMVKRFFLKKVIQPLRRDNFFIEQV